MNLLVTGGAGFAGSNFIRHILKKYPNYTIVNLDKLTYAGNLDNLRDIEGNSNYKFIKGDIADKRIVFKVCRNFRIEAVINYAAETHVDRSILDPDAFVKTDVLGTFNILEAVKEFKLKKFVQISTDEVYGSITKGKFTEESPFLPNSPYSASKASADLLCRAYLKTYNLPIIVTHSCNFYGPYQYPEKLMPLFITNLLEGKKVPLYGDGKNVREWIYVLDHCWAIDFLLHKGALGEVYNIGTGTEKKNLEITEIILKSLNKDKKMVEHIVDRPGHDLRYAVDWTKLKKMGWNPEYDFDRAIRETVRWYQQNEWWWKKLKSGAYLEYYKKQYRL
ncbi:MAG: dTDP-glucose 4,6-dehydratase [Candidatus Komeilibacteria bacterium]|nr:dTDP-glucose 4,6-dehydratase [Candidatus Komeilibacteria bacterium]